ncbi:ABC transporter ATP-binding protein [Chelativorans sp. Marseille-P2723]|uniref:ABC transporter ATP-binding protein n=1 Tax=Chelativorans sp. Marseille-P2723 TaxID=2709133 RepID=UPI0015713F78|nr:ABC transporter ATP-binding protein [Chelativorans sp. Marseille-P2723]
MTTALEVSDVDVVFASGIGGRLRNMALRNITMAVGGERSSITAVVGQSGSGKSTLIRLLLGVQAATRGSVSYAGRPLHLMSRKEQMMFRREVQAIFQDPFDVFNPFYRIDHALLAPLRNFGLVASRDEAYAEIEQTLKVVGLEPGQTLGRYPHQLSGGQRQRVMIARALLLDPAIILADEPVSMVDASLRSTILDILYDLYRVKGISLVYVTHDLATAYQVAETIVVLNGGQVMEVGDAEAVIHDPKHPYTQALIAAVPSPDPDIPWNLEADPAEKLHEVDATIEQVLFRVDPLRAIAGPPDRDGEKTTIAKIQQAVSDAQDVAK